MGAAGGGVGVAGAMRVPVILGNKSISCQNGQQRERK